MKQPKIPMTKEQWILFCKSLKYGDRLYVFTDDITGEIIETFSADKNSPDKHKFTKYLNPAHVFRYLGLGRGATVEADPKGTQWHLIDEYRDRVMAGDVRIIVSRSANLTMTEFENIKAEAERQIGKPYGWGAIIGFGLVKLFRETFIGNLWRWAKWQTPFCSRESPVCSQGLRLQDDNCSRFYVVLKKLSAYQANTPQRNLDEIINISALIMDTFLIGRENNFEY